MTSNVNFVRLAGESGVAFSVFMHPARALTEQKTAAERAARVEAVASSQ